MAAVRAWVRNDVARRWRSLVVLALLVAMACATVMTAFSGARRGSTSLDRLLDQTRPATAIVQATFGGLDYEELERLPYVETVSRFVLAFTPAIEGVAPEAIDFPRLDDATMDAIERPVVLEGRGYDPDAPDEAVVTDRFRSRYDLGVGDTVRLHLATQEQVDETINQATSADDLRGPVLDVRIVGVVRTPILDLPDAEGRISFSPALAEAYLPELTGSIGYAPVNALIRLERGAADLPALRADIVRLSGRQNVDVVDLAARYDRAERGLRFEAGWLAGFGIAALLAAVVLVGQAVARAAAGTAAELRTGLALGMTPREVRLAAAAPPVLAGVVGTVLGTAASVQASAWFPMGRAAALEPRPGVEVDPVVLVPGAILCLAIVSVIAFGATVLAARPDVSSHRRSRLATAAGRFGLPVPLVVGLRFALERGRGRSTLPVVPTQAAAVVGVLGVIAAATVGAAVEDAATHPERFGQNHQVVAWVGGDGEDLVPAVELAAWLGGRDEVVSVHDVRAGVVNRPDGHGSVTLWSDGSGRLPTTVLDGRMPERPDEVALAPGTQDELGVEIGEAVPVATAGGERTLRLVGTAFVVEGPASSYNEGGWVTAAGFDRLFDRFLFHFLLATAHDDGGLAERLDEALLAEDATATWASQVGTPASDDFDTAEQVGELDRVRSLPTALGTFLALLAVGGIGHAAVAAVRRRARELAVLRAIGVSPNGCRSAVVTQAVVLVVIGLVLGVPLGIAAGRSVWREVADFVPLEFVPPPLLLPVGATVAGALSVSVLLSLLPATRAARASVASILRTE